MDAIATLEQCVAAFYSGSQEQMAAADATLAPAREHPRPWELLQALCSRSGSTPAILYCTTLVDTWIRRRWRWASADERAACKGVLAPLVVGAAAFDSHDKEGEIRAAKLEGVLVRLLRHDWPEGWPDFVPSLLGAALPPPAVLRILNLVGEEALRHGGARRAAAVRAALAMQFAPVIELCRHALSGGGEPAAAAAALGVLARYAPWLPEAAVLDPSALATLPSLLGLHPTRTAALQLAGSLARLPPPAAAAAAAAHCDALASAVATLQAHIPAERLAATGGAPGWTEAQLAQAASLLNALWATGRHALLRSPSGADVLAHTLALAAAFADGAAHSGDSEAVRLALEMASALADAQVRRGALDGWLEADVLSRATRPSPVDRLSPLLAPLLASPRLPSPRLSSPRLSSHRLLTPAAPRWPRLRSSCSRRAPPRCGSCASACRGRRSCTCGPTTATKTTPTGGQPPSFRHRPTTVP